MPEALLKAIGSLDSLFPFSRGLLFFLAALLLALLEIQIEGPNGWAEGLPTWRWDSPAIRRLAGKPITGYHVYLLSLLFLLWHLPVAYAGFSAALESELLAFFFLLSVFWDFLWFALNPHFGLRRFRRGQVWWFPAWWGPLPSAYWMGAASSLLAWLFPAFLSGGPSLGRRLAGWGCLFVEFAFLAAGAVCLRALRRRPGDGGNAG